MRVFWGMAVLCVSLSGCGLLGGGEEGNVSFRGTLRAESMEPTLRSGDKVVAHETGADGPRSGDVVVYRDPGGWLGLDKDDGSLVHRVIGVPGDTLTCGDARGRLAVNGKALDEPYIASEPGACNAALLDLWAARPGTAIAGECRWTVGPVPADRIFVLGDNRGHSADSRAHLCPAAQECPDGPWVPVDLVRGVVELP